LATKQAGAEFCARQKTFDGPAEPATPCKNSHTNQRGVARGMPRPAVRNRTDDFAPLRLEVAVEAHAAAAAARLEPDPRDVRATVRGLEADLRAAPQEP
jgi:hypothetical protein